MLGLICLSFASSRLLRLTILIKVVSTTLLVAIFPESRSATRQYRGCQILRALVLKLLRDTSVSILSPRKRFPGFTYNRDNVNDSK